MTFERHHLSSHLKDNKLFQDNSREHRYYIHEDGTEFMSVTSFLSKFSDKSSLEAWKTAVGETEAARISKLATDKGTAIHDAAEKLLLNDPSHDNISFVYKPDFIPLKRYLKANVNSVLATEHMMYSRKIKLAGTVDCLAEHNGVLSVIDYKTSSGIKYESDIPGYFLQCACYGIMAFELYGISIKQISILMSVAGQREISVFNQPLVPWAKKVLELCNVQPVVRQN